VKIYYVAECLGGDFDNIPISMFGQPALFTERGAADKFCVFASGAGRVHEVREWECRAAGREEAVDKGPWRVGMDGRELFSDNFTVDASLRITGDFRDEAHRREYAEALCSVLNRPTAPAGNGGELEKFLDEMQFSAIGYGEALYRDTDVQIEAARKRMGDARSNLIRTLAKKAEGV